ncbi:hypothetical protein AQ769_22785 [Burkholderia pseudomallei]|nr:hypothetical protein AQ769_22785 [Burkholderia pseudomallei]
MRPARAAPPSGDAFDTHARIPASAPRESAHCTRSGFDAMSAAYAYADADRPRPSPSACAASNPRIGPASRRCTASPGSPAYASSAAARIGARRVARGDARRRRRAAARARASRA